MHSVNNDYALLMSSIASPDCSRELVATVTTIAKSIPEAAKFVDYIVAKQRVPFDGGTGSLEKAMRILESFAEQAKLPALMLITHLWIYADQLMDHATCNSIDIWLSENGCSESREYVKQFIAVETDEFVKKHFDQLHWQKRPDFWS